AELVDEPPEPAAADEGDERAVVRRQERDGEDDGHRHHQGTPDRVRDVQRPVSQLRVPGDDQEHAVPDHGPDRADQEQIQSTTDLGAAEREARDVEPADLGHLAVCQGGGNYALRRSPSSVVISVGCTRSITTARSITQRVMSSRLGRSYITSSSTPSRMARNPRAPVPRLSASSPTASRASSVNTSSTSSKWKNFWYCFSTAVFGP